MDVFKAELVSLLYFLLPGFISAWIFYGLTAHPKKEAFERVVQAFIFTAIVNVIVIGERKLWWTHWHPTHLFGEWTAEKQTTFSIVTAVVVGLVFSFCANWNFCHWLLRKAKITKRTAYPSEWYSGFHRFRRDVVLHLKGSRRLKGWADEWPDQCEKGHFLIESPIWLDESGKEYRQTLVERIMIPATEVEMVEFYYDASKFSEEKLKQIEEERKALAVLQQSKEKADGRGTTEAKPDNPVP